MLSAEEDFVKGLVLVCFTLAIGCWLLALHVVMLNLFQHLTASLFLHFLRGQILKRVQDDERGGL